MNHFAVLSTDERLNFLRKVGDKQKALGANTDADFRLALAKMCQNHGWTRRFTRLGQRDLLWTASEEDFIRMIIKVQRNLAGTC